MRFLPLTFAVFVCVASTGQAQTVFLRPQDCVRAPASLIPKQREWRPEFRPYIDMCPIRAPNGTIALRLLTFRLDRAKHSGFFSGKPCDLDLPDPVLLDKEGRSVDIIGDATLNIPNGVQMSFASWRDGFPWQINVHLNNPVYGNWETWSDHWDPKKHQFQDDSYP